MIFGSTIALMLVLADIHSNSDGALLRLISMIQSEILTGSLVTGGLADGHLGIEVDGPPGTSPATLTRNRVGSATFSLAAFWPDMTR